MATAASILHEAFDYFHWTGFYRAAPAGGQAVQAAQPPGAQAGAAPAPAAPGGPQQRRRQQGLVIGPYQGHMGCLRIPLDKGVCGAAARTRLTQLVPDVHQFPGHIACASA